ncbi:MAG TPA: phosphoserine phosphatase SerB [Microbacteriaceae bacterium]|nr:phosphoserine phosphatase SerB [Microbacteriaceae bacterium]
MVSLLLVLDADSTLIQNEVIELLADEAGSRALVADITERAMRGDLDFSSSLAERVATLAGLDTAAAVRVRSRVVVTPGARELIAAVHACGGRVGVVSGGFHEVLDPIAEDLGIDVWRANRLEHNADRFTGRVLGDVVDASMKATTLAEWSSAFGSSRTVAIGDGANDLKMLASADLGVAFCAKPIVRAQADVAIDQPDLSTVIAALGLS